MNDRKIIPTFLVVSVVSILLSQAVIAPSGEYSVTVSSGEGGNVGGVSTATVSAAPSDSGGGGGGSSSGGTTTTTPSTTTPKTPTPTEPTPPVAVTPVSEPVTDTATIQQVVNVINPADLGVTEVNVENVQVTKTAVAETTTTTQSAILQQTVDQVLPTATEPAAQQVLNEIKQAVSSGSSSPIAVNVQVEVFEVKEKTTNKTAFSTKFTLTIEGKEDSKNLKIVEVIPKSVAANVIDVVFQGEQPDVLQADPIVQWTFPTLQSGETKSLSYAVPKKVETVETKTIATAEAVALPTPPIIGPTPAPSPNYVYILIGLVGAAAVGYLVYKNFIVKK